MRYRLILPERISGPVLEFDSSEVTKEKLQAYNEQGYNIYYFPNDSSVKLDHNLKSTDVDVWNWVFIDMDLKDQVYNSVSEFLTEVKTFAVKPTKCIQSGHGVHVYWQIGDLDRDSYLHLQKALISRFKTDKAIWNIARLMRVPGYNNTKSEDLVMCDYIKDNDLNTNQCYNSADLWKHLDPISFEDKRDIDNHVNKHIHGIKITQHQLRIVPLPGRFEKMLENSENLNEWFYHPVDRSDCDMKITNALQMNNFTREEALSIIAQTHKGQEAGVSYVQALVDKVYDNPLSALDSEYDAIHAAVSVDRYYDDLARENKRYKIEQEHTKIVEAKKVGLLQDKYTLHGSESELAVYYVGRIKAKMASRQKRLTYMTPRLTKVMPLYGDNVILIGAKTGTGKTSALANIVSPLLKEGKAIACISTEETSEDTLFRNYCLQHDLNVANSGCWYNDTHEKQFQQDIQGYLESKQLQLYDSYTYGVDKDTGAKIQCPEMTSIEGLLTALADIEKSPRLPDVLIIDYISKIGSSKSVRNEMEWQIIYKAAAILEEWCKKLNVPSIIFSQLEDSSESRSSFKSRLPGSKRIMNLVTVAIELDVDYENKTTQYICHKNRMEQILFRKTVRYDRGLFVDVEGETDTVEESD